MSSQTCLCKRSGSDETAKIRSVHDFCSEIYDFSSTWVGKMLLYEKYVCMFKVQGSFIRHVLNYTGYNQE